MKGGNLCCLSLMLLGVISLAETRSVNYLCKEGAPTYRAHPTDCEKFVQCYTDALGNLVGGVQSCPFSTYWSRAVLNCLPAEQIRCISDKCADLPDKTIRGGNGNCRGFWECNGGRSVPRCCHLGQRFVETVGCIDTENEDDDCKDTCMGVEYDWGNETVTANETVVCNKSPVVGEPGSYFEEAVGMVFKRICAIGTVFDQDKCECDFAKEPAKKAACKPEIYLPYMLDNMPGTPHFIGNHHVNVKDGSAEFNGVNSRLSIPLFNNMEHVDSMVIRINYTSASGRGVYPQVLVSNTGCGYFPSIVISENEDDVIFEIGTTKNLTSSVAVQKPVSMTTEKIVEFKFLDDRLTGSVNGVTSHAAVYGFLRNVQCDLSIGGVPDFGNIRLKNMANFNGVINELSVYLCDPEMSQ